MDSYIKIITESALEARPIWDEYFLKIAISIASRASCFKVHAGSVLVKDNRIIGTGYNGAPCGLKSCLELGMCEKEKITGKDYMDKSRPQTCRGMHSETNAISYSIRETDGATLYATIFPCNDCTKHIIANKIKRVVFKNFYNENEYDVALNKFKEAGVEVCNLNISFKRLIAIDFFAAKENANFGIWKEDEREEVREFLSPHL